MLSVDVEKHLGEVQIAAKFTTSGGATALFGPSGAGKTSIVNMIAGLLKPDRGRISVDGVDAAAHALQVRQRLGVLPDARGLYKRLTARENIEYYAQLHALAAQTVRTRIEALIQALGMQEIINRRVEGFSQGERVKTAIARALVNRPSILFADEPTGNLDSKNGENILQLLAEIQKSLGMTIIMVTHERPLAERFASRTIFLSDGKLVGNPSPGETAPHSGDAQ